MSADLTPPEAPPSARAEAPMLAEPFDRAAFAAATNASEAQLADLDQFLELLTQRNAQLNLVGPSALTAFWLRHAYDSAQLLALAPEALVWADIGAGAGFPGLILAILLKGRPGAQVHLVDSTAKRCRFLEEACTVLDLPAVVHNARAEDLELKVDAVTARAVAPLVKLLGYAWPYLCRGATGLFLKGQDVEVELKAATRYWKFHARLIQSLSSAQGRIVQLKRISRVRPG